MTDRFVKTGVIGHPISHSKSPLIHSYWIDKYGLSGSYEAIDFDTDNFKQGVADLIEKGFSGFNITIPHKIAAMNVCDELSEEAKQIGAVNTIYLNKHNKICGTNTDAFGFIHNIRQNKPEEWDFNYGKALILGAGGAAQAIVYGLLKAGVPEVILVNRTREKAEAIASNFDRLVVSDWSERHALAAECTLIVNTTSLGMEGQAELDLDLSGVRDALVTDIVYAPLMTPLLVQAQALNLPIVTGIGMLLHQARPGFELWHGIMPEVTPELEELVLSS